MPTILITGVSTGLGRACAQKFAAQGWKVIGTLREVSGKSPGACDAVESLDLSVPNMGADLAGRVLAKHGCPDVVLNNAAMLVFGPIEGTKREQWDRLLQVNLLGQLEVINGFVPAMRERASGVIVNVTSLGGRMTFPFFGAYNTTKWALEGATEALWHELKPFGIKVKAIEPGFIETAIWGKVLPAPGAGTGVPAPYEPYAQAMLEFEKAITDRTSPESCAEEVFSAIVDPSERLRYPVAAYARPILRARRILGDQAMLRFFHKRWLGPESG
jgi:NAD(P)-dependent dehydrogenase (short-subunit alcohol dehydrogenase family)